MQHSTNVSLLAISAALFAPGLVSAQPVMSDPSRFTVELYADFAPLGRLKAWELSITAGENGFAPGMYVTSGPLTDDGSDRLVRVFGPQQFEVVADGFVSNESLVFGRGIYGNGMLITEPRLTRIVRLQPSGDRTVFASGFTPPFGPAVVTYGPDPDGGQGPVLYTTDFASGDLLILDANGNKRVFASIPVTPTTGFKDVGTNPSIVARYGGFLAGLFNFSADPGAGAIYVVSADNGNVTPLATGLEGIQMITPGPGGVFGRDAFVASDGGDFPVGNGAVYTLSPDGVLTEFMTNLDPASVCFDTDRLLGGGMFVADINDDLNVASKIWRVTAVACPPDFNNDGVVDTRDVLAFLNAWTAGDPRSDFNNDGVIDTRDVLAFLNAWTAGC